MECVSRECGGRVSVLASGWGRLRLPGSVSGGLSQPLGLCPGFCISSVGETLGECVGVLGILSRTVHVIQVCFRVGGGEEGGPRRALESLEPWGWAGGLRSVWLLLSC